MLGSAALHDSVSELAQPVAVDIAGRRIDLAPADATRLRDAAAACAGTSSVSRDLALLLDRGLQGRRLLALRRSEAQALMRVASDGGLPNVADEIAAQLS